jgi:excinuclease ABC subunit C
MKSQGLAKLKLPAKPGVYFFYKGKELLYIGKATSLRDRTKSYFAKDLINTRGPSIVDMVFKSTTVKFQETDSVLEALILEAELIKKHQPYYNVKEKDDKSWNYVCITKPARRSGGDAWPILVIERGKNLKRGIFDKVYGPFTSGLQLKEALRIIRRIFPYLDSQAIKKDNYEFYKQLGLAPEFSPPAKGEWLYSAEGVKQYQKNIRHLKLFFQGKKKEIVKELKREMMKLAKEQKFELANEVKRKVFALEHINDVALLRNESEDYRNSSVFTLPALAGGSYNQQNFANSRFRLEAYDVAHMSGKNMVGVMTVVENGEVAKSEYKKFIIRTQSGSNDTGALEEILSRRFRHTEWGMPDLVVVDGAQAQMNVAKQVLDRYQFKIPIVAVVKDESHKAREILGEQEYAKKFKRQILLANSEAHRFAITFHKLKRSKNFLI